jgi:ATP-dependent HslUV protease ATP-binding subunit HslU
MVRDLVDSAINLVRTEREDEVYPQAEQKADERLLDLLLPPGPSLERTEKADKPEKPKAPAKVAAKPA